MKIFLSLFLACFNISAGVRTLLMNDTEMEVIRLVLGKSTILRFKSQPKKIVLGNQNSYKIDFVNNDLTIQLKRFDSTNLFVYTKKNVYGFLLLPSKTEDYDDIVNIRRKYGGKPYKLKNPVPVFRQPLDFRIQGIRTIGGNLFTAVVFVQNRTRHRINTSKINILATVANKRLPLQKAYFKKDSLGGGKITEARVVFKAKKKKRIVFNLTYANTNLKKEVKWKR